MKHLKKVVRGIMWMTSGCLCASSLVAQQGGGDRPKPAAHQSLLLLGSTDIQQDTDQSAQTVQPDNWPLSGLQNPTIGSPEMRHSYWVPGIQYSKTARSNSYNSVGSSNWNTTSFVSADFSLLEAWSHSKLSANYSGGGYFSTDNNIGHGQFQQLAANYEIGGRRWQAVFVDQFSYLPQSSFGFGGATGLFAPGIAGTLAVPLPGLQAPYLPGQTVFTIGPRYSNSSAVQLTYQVSARGSFIVAGVYGMLRFVDPGNVNSDTEMTNLGYDYSITRRDRVGLSYRFGAYRYPGNQQALGDHIVELEYGRKITGKLGLKLMGGPEVTNFRISIGSLTRRISGFGSASLMYAFPSSSVELHYMHGVSGGSGVFTGAISDQLGATLGKQLTRIWNGNINFGYAKNRGILATSGAPTFDSWYAGAGVSRSLGRLANLSLGYQAQIQAGRAAPLGANYTAHQIFLSFQWHTRPLVLH